MNLPFVMYAGNVIKDRVVLVGCFQFSNIMSRKSFHLFIMKVPSVIMFVLRVPPKTKGRRFNYSSTDTDFAWVCSLPFSYIFFNVLFCFVLFVSSSLIADGANQRATTLPIPRVVTRDLPISPRFTPTSFYRDAGSAFLHLILLHLVNQWLNFSYSRRHAFHNGNQKNSEFLRSL